MTTDSTGVHAAPRVFTIGHSTREFDEVLAMLHANGVTCLVDVRAFPSSRKFPQWTARMARLFAWPRTPACAAAS